MTNLKVKPCLLAKIDGKDIAILPGTEIIVDYKQNEKKLTTSGTFLAISCDLVVFLSHESGELWLSFENIIKIAMINNE